jgi:hypothetical protein
LSYEFTSDVLKHKTREEYTAGEISGGNCPWRPGYMGLLLEELWKLDHEPQPHFLARPTQWSDFDRRMYRSVYVFMMSFVKPDLWRYYDPSADLVGGMGRGEEYAGTEGSNGYHGHYMINKNRMG